MFCTNCGNKVADDALFCTSCGEKLAKTMNLINRSYNYYG
ncbi:MAG: zinc-ribbon domain-containing protein [Ruminococcaceae bacterium]|nr:zinc-ribbon domain-containing protein [Oscillospiraceae bacterium]